MEKPLKSLLIDNMGHCTGRLVKLPARRRECCGPPAAKASRSGSPRLRDCDFNPDIKCLKPIKAAQMANVNEELGKITAKKL